MEAVTVYAANGATFTCKTQERLERYLKAGWTKEPPKRGKRATKGEATKGEETKGEKPEGQEG